LTYFRIKNNLMVFFFTIISRAFGNQIVLWKIVEWVNIYPKEKESPKQYIFMERKSKNNTLCQSKSSIVVFDVIYFINVNSFKFDFSVVYY